MSDTLNDLLVELDMLNQLGSANAIAEYFKGIGIKGRRHKSRNCPLFVFLRNYKRFSVECVSGKSVGYKDENIYLQEVYTHISEFVVDFDMNTYPELVEVKNG